MIKEKMQNALNNQINLELYSAYLYLSMSAYFESINLKGFANWMKVQAQEELNHAMKFYDHINERGGKMTLKAVEAPKTEWKSPLDAFEDTYKHEQKITSIINKLVDLSESENDYPSKSLLQWFVDEQVEEEASADEIVKKLKLIKESPNGLLMLDSILSKRKYE